MVDAIKPPEDSTHQVLEALADPQWDFRSADALVRATGLPKWAVLKVLDENPDKVRKTSAKSQDVYRLSARGFTFAEVFNDIKRFVGKAAIGGPVENSRSLIDTQNQRLGDLREDVKSVERKIDEQRVGLGRKIETAGNRLLFVFAVGSSLIVILQVVNLVWSPGGNP